MLKDEVITYLKEVMPFNFLSHQELESLVTDIVLDYYPRGTKILTQDGPPSENLGIIKKGGVKIYIESDDDGETIIDYRSEKEQFGLLSLVGGDRSRTNVEAIEDTICYLISKDKILTILHNNPAANDYFLKSFFINFIDKTYEKTKIKPSGLSESERLLYTTPVGQVVRRAPVTVVQTVSIQEAAQRMAGDKISSLIVVDDTQKPVGMLTDRDLREKVVATARDASSPIQEIMSSSVVSIDAAEYCFEALLKMIRHKIHHILVLDGENLKGMVTNHDFMSLQGSSPTALIKDISAIQSLADLHEASSNLYKTVTALLNNGAKASNITGFITEFSEALINKAAALVEDKLGPPPLLYTLFIFGDGGRQELSLACNIKLGIVFQDTDNAERQKEATTYFTQYSDEVNTSLSTCLSCSEQCLPIKDIKNRTQWRKFFDQQISETNSGPLASFFEIRAILGIDKVVDELRHSLWKKASEDDDFRELLALATIQNQPPLGFFKQFVVEKSGEHKDLLNLYSKGIKPLNDVVRIFSIERGIHHLTTIARLRALTKIKQDFGPEIEHALEYLRGLLLHKQISQIESGNRADNFVNPEELDSFAKKNVKDSFQLIANLYEEIEQKYSTHW